MRSRIVFLAVAAACLGHAWAFDVQEESSLHVFQPPELAGDYVHSEALFGRPAYGGAITGTVVYGTPGVNATGCGPITRNPSWPADPIIMLDRGDCTFVQKVRHAENAGASAVLIVDNKPLCGPTSQGGSPQCPSCTNCMLSNTCECRLPYLAGDSSGSAVSVPTFMVSLADGDKFKACLQGDAPCSSPETIALTFQWSLPTSSGVVDWELWTISQGGGSSANFIKSFAPFVKPLASAVQFEPHYFIYDGTYWDCTRKVGTGYRCGTQCTNQGRYCAPDPDRHLHQGLSGYDTIRENLRQICIWKQVAPAYSSTFGLPWWNYVTLFNQNCPGSQFNNDTCSEVQQVAAGVDPAATNLCMAQSGGLGDDGDNTILKHGLEERQNLAIMLLPTIIVNGVIERGSSSAGQVAETICAGYEPGTEPTLCTCMRDKGDYVASCIEGGDTPAPEDGGLAGWAIALLVLAPIVTLAIGGGFYYLHRKSRAEMKEILRMYQTLPGSNDHNDDDVGMEPNVMNLQLRPLGSAPSAPAATSAPVSKA